MRQSMLEPGLWGVLLLHVLVSVAAAQPDAIDQLTQADRLSDGDKAKIEGYAEYWTTRLGSTDQLKAVGEARDALLKHLSGRETPVFREAYSRALLPVLRPIVDDRNLHLPAMNAMQIIGQLGTQDALGEVVGRAHRRDEDRVVIRIWAARGVSMILEDADEVVLPTARRNPAVRDLGFAAQNETEWPALLAQLTAIASSGVQIKDDVMLAAVHRVLERLDGDNQASPLMRAIRRSVLMMRSMFLESETTTLGRRVMDELVLMLAVAEKHWDSAQADADHKRTYQAAIKAAEGLMQYIDRRIGELAIGKGLGGQTELEKAFEERNFEKYSSQVNTIERITAAPPYK